MSVKISFWSPTLLQFQFEIGVHEHHRVQFRFNQSLGMARISIDGRPVMRRFERLGVSRLKRYSLDVGELERHRVVIEKPRTRPLGERARLTCTVWVDGTKVREFTPAPSSSASLRRPMTGRATA